MAALNKADKNNLPKGVPQNARILAFFDIGVVPGLNALLKPHGLKIRYRGSPDIGDEVYTWVEKIEPKTSNKD